MKSSCLMEIENGQVFEGFALVKEAKDGTASNNSSYFDITLGKQTKTVMGKLWENKFNGYTTAELKNIFKAGSLVLVQGRVGEYRSNLQITIESFRPAVEGEADVSDFVSSAPEPTDSLTKEYEEFLDAIQSPILKEITSSIYQDHKKAFIMHPAAKSNHHTFISGLLYHTVSMLRIGKSIADQYPQIDRDLVYSGISLHDLGKVIELGFEGFVPSYTTTGSLLGHITIVNMLIDRKIQSLATKEKGKYGRKDFDKAIQLMHVVSSHHGKQEWGSPVAPALLEAEIIHHIDMIDSRINMITNGLADKTEGEMHKIYPLGNFYKPFSEA